jgi:hypothetical protein
MLDGFGPSAWFSPVSDAGVRHDSPRPDGHGEDWDYGAAADGTGGAVTGQKPESKLWFAGGTW